MAKPTVRRYGWIPDRPDHRDLKYDRGVVTMAALPVTADLRGKCPAVYDQGDIGSCTANALAGNFHFDELKQKQTPVFTPSRLFIYYNERVLEDSVDSDSGAMIRDGIKAMAQWGVADEAVWPYVDDLLYKKPTKKVYTGAKTKCISKYLRIDNTVLEDLKHCLAAGYPIVFGMSVYESFESDTVARTGMVPMPKRSESEIGGHAMLIVGYRDKEGCFIVRNSWGADWGKKGYCYIPYAYLTDPNLADDFWTIRMVP